MIEPHFHIERHPDAADGAVWTVYSPEHVSVWRTDDHEEAIAVRNRRNNGEVWSTP